MSHCELVIQGYVAVVAVTWKALSKANDLFTENIFRDNYLRAPEKQALSLSLSISIYLFIYLSLSPLSLFLISDLIHCTNEPNVSIPQLANLLIERSQNTNWTVVFKALITVHHMLCYGNEVKHRRLSLQNARDALVCRLLIRSILKYNFPVRRGLRSILPPATARSSSVIFWTRAAYKVIISRYDFY